MKHQYFGDENDYRKYGLLRALGGTGNLKLGVCWMLTPDDGRSDGRFTDYLRQPLHRRHDPDLYDGLSAAMATGVRRLDHLRQLDLLPEARFHSALIPDQRTQRAGYFESVMSAMKGVDLLFFDPDNGIEVPSRPKGRRNSSKYLFWDEIEAAYSAKHSLLIYQHYPREARTTFTTRMAETLRARTGAVDVLAFATSRVLFLLAAQQQHAPALSIGARAVAQAWRSQIDVMTLSP